MNIINLFPTPVASFSLPRELTEQELSFVCNQQKQQNEGNYTSKNTNVLNSPELKDLSIWINERVVEYFNEVHKPKDDLKIYITQSWLNYTNKNEFHHKHNHPCSFISGCFYPKTDVDTDRIYFFNGNKHHYLLQIPSTDYNIWNSYSWWLPVGTGGLILFPSELTHMVAPKETEGERVSLSFNTFLKGKLGNDDNLTGLYL